MKIFLCVLLFLILCWLVPLLLILCINTLFSLSIAYTLVNWAAALFLILIIGRGA
jgi:hypothetical protein